MNLRMNAFQSQERAALESVDTEEKLHKRLLKALDNLPKGLQERFEGASLNTQEKRMESCCGGWALQWQTRAKPSQPVSLNNFQSSTGTVLILERKE